jgi:hypothetical protein
MKKTKIITGALMLAALFGVNGFAFTNTIPDKQQITAAFPEIKQEIGKILNKTEKEQKNTENTKNIFFEEEFTANFHEETFTILLPKYAQEINSPSHIQWTENDVEFIVEKRFPFPYLYITVIQKENVRPITMHVKIAISSGEKDYYALFLKYKKDDMEFSKELGSLIMPNFLKMRSHTTKQNFVFNKTFTVQDTVRISISTELKNHKIYGAYHNTEYFSYTIMPNIINPDPERSSFILIFSNDNPLIKEVPVTIIKEDNKIYFSYTIGDNSYKDIFAEKL